MEGGQQREAKEEVRKAMDPSCWLQLSQVLQDIRTSSWSNEECYQMRQ